jgi:hypothetical protein
MPSGSEVLRDGTIGGEEVLGLPYRFEPLHPPLAMAGGLVGVFRVIIEVPVLVAYGHATRHGVPPDGTGLAARFGHGCEARHARCVGVHPLAIQG